MILVITGLCIISGLIIGQRQGRDLEKEATIAERMRLIIAEEAGL